MPIVRLFGKIHPEFRKFTLPQPINVNWGSADLGFPLVMHASVKESAFEISSDLPRFEDSMTSTLCARGANLMRAYMDAAAFSTGLGFVMTWTYMQKPDGKMYDISSGNEYLAPLCTAYTFPPRNAIENQEFNEIVRLMLGEPQLLGAMMDLADTLYFHHQTPTNCGRVLDALRKALAPNKAPSAGWTVLQKALRLSRSYTEWISEQSTDPRHGERVTPIPEQTVKEISIRTWNIVNRFLEYRKRGNHPLPESEFSLLSGDFEETFS